LVEDFREGHGLQVYEADVCIVGAGPAGIAIARAFAGTRHRICLLESGGLRCESDAQALLEGASIGLPGLHPAHSRLRVYGGSCRLWGGGCIPLAPAEFGRREWVPHSGWPIGYRDLAPYYERARAECGLQSAPLEGGSFALRHRHAPLLKDSAELVNTTVALSPVEFGRDSLPELARAPNVRVLLHANLLQLCAPSEAGHIREAHIGAVGGRRGTVRARFYVLAAGGIENARLLLTNESTLGRAGNRHGLVGRFFQDHPRIRLGTMARGHMDRLMRAYGRTTRVSTSLLELGLSEDAARSQQILACRARPFAVWASPSPGMQALRELRAYLGRARDDVMDEGTALESDLVAVLDRDLPAPLPPPDKRKVRPLRTALRAGRHGGDVAAGVLRMLAGRSHLRSERVEIVGYFEQAPNPDSRIELDERQDALGQHRVRVDWRMTELDRRTHRVAGKLFGKRLAHACGSSFQPDAWLEDPEGVAVAHGTAHHLGTTRMAANPREGVVDPHCRMHGIDNLYVTGSSVFPTGGWAFPTFTIIALSLRLADHLRSRLEMLTPLIGT
jgi:choline dehydrogenase-like flavoprotein